MKRLQSIFNFRKYLFLFLCSFGSISHALVLENLIQAGTLESTLQGKKIATKYEAHTLGGCMALPVHSFVVAMRANDDLASLSAVKYIIGQ